MVHHLEVSEGGELSQGEVRSESPSAEGLNVPLVQRLRGGAPLPYHNQQKYAEPIEKKRSYGQVVLYTHHQKTGFWPSYRGENSAYPQGLHSSSGPARCSAFYCQQNQKMFLV